MNYLVFNKDTDEPESFVSLSLADKKKFEKENKDKYLISEPDLILPEDWE